MIIHLQLEDNGIPPAAAETTSHQEYFDVLHS